MPSYTKVIWSGASGYAPANSLVSTSETINLGEQWAIRIKDKYRKHLGGKITIPTYTDSSRQHKVAIIEDLSNMTQVTEVFFLDDSECVGSYPFASNRAFYFNSNMTNIHLPASFKYVGQGCFGFCGGLTDIDFGGAKIEYVGDRAFGNCSQLAITELPDSIAYIGDSGFYNCNALKLRRLPLELKQARESCFQSCYDMEVNTFGYTVGQAELGNFDSKLELICTNAFNGVGNNPAIDEIFIKSSIKTIAVGAFSNYGDVGGTLKIHDDSGIIRDQYDAQGNAIVNNVFGPIRHEYVD
jgi:hypothetical protein